MKENNYLLGKKMHNLAKKLWPINRSLTGDGVRQTLLNLKKICPNLKILEIPSGKKVFDWTIPKEWNVKEAWIKNQDGKKIVDFSKNNLHLMGYSVPIYIKLSLKKLKKNLYTLKKQPSAIPYITSYYKKNWGFALPYKIFKKLKNEKYEVFINSELKNGNLTLGEIYIPGKKKKEILISTNICHPSMANNELSGPVVSIYLAKWIKSKKNRKYFYIFLFLPETIGSITYLSKKFKYLKKYVIAGFNVVCVGDNRAYSYLPSRKGNTLSDIIAKHLLKWKVKKFNKYSWLDRGSDERQYCSPGIDLPVASIMRSKYATYPEYHTSLDDLSKVVTPAGLDGGFNILKKALQLIEDNFLLKSLNQEKIEYDKKSLYPKINLRSVKFKEHVLKINNIIHNVDKKISAVEIADKLSISFWKFLALVKILENNKIVKKINYL